MNYDSANLELLLDNNRYSVPNESEEDYTVEQDGTIVLCQPGLDGGEDVEIKVGEFSYTIINSLAAINDGVSLYDVFDCWQGANEIFNALYDPSTLEYKHDVMTAAKLWVTDYHSPNLIFFDRFVIHPEFVGLKFGLRALRKLLQQHQHSSMVVISLNPLQYYDVKSDAQAHANAKLLGVSHAEISEQVAIEKLERHFARLRFNRVPGTHYMVRDACHHLPSVETMLGPQQPAVNPAKPPRPGRVYRGLISRMQK